MVAALLVLVSLWQAFNMASAIIQISWVVISLVGIARVFFLRHRLHFTPEEQIVLDKGLPGTPRENARRILDAGIWMTAETRFRLTIEGEPVKQLFFITEGRVRVLVGGKQVASLEQGFIGEMNVTSGDAASATVEAETSTRLFCISGENLRRLTRKDSLTDSFIGKHLSMATKRKLLEANKRMTKGA